MKPSLKQLRAACVAIPRASHKLVLLMTVVVTVISTPSSLAMSVEQKQLMHDGVRYFDIATSSTNECSTGNDSLSGNTNEGGIWQWLRDKGMSEYGAAGIMGNMSVESGFNPFRIQVSASLRTYDSLVGSDASGNAFGLVQWDGSRRLGILKSLAAEDAGYKQYVSDKYGKAASDYKHAPTDINEKFILHELAYMYKESTPGGARPTTWKALLSARSETAAASKFEEIFEGSVRPAGGSQDTEATRIYNRYKGTVSSDSPTPSGGSSSGDCSSDGGSGSLVSGGMNVSQAKAFMQKYVDYAKGKSGRGLKPASYNGRSFQLYYSGCSGGPLANCSTFSEFFVGAFTSGKQAFPNGGLMVSELLKTHSGFVDGGHTPKVYAVFSRKSGGGGRGHTGVVLGIDKDRGKIVIGQAGCGVDLELNNGYTVAEYSLKEWTNNPDYSYAYTDNILKVEPE